MKMAIDRFYVIILIIAWVLPAKLSESSLVYQCNVRNCVECDVENPYFCLKCSNNYILRGNRCVLNNLDLVSIPPTFRHNFLLNENSLRKPTEQPESTLPDIAVYSHSLLQVIQNVNKTVTKVFRNIEESNNNCEIENCKVCDTRHFCKQCKDINYFVNDNGKCIHFCFHMNCKICHIAQKDKSWICKKCLEGYDMDSVKSI